MADQVYKQSLSDFITNAPTTKLTRIFKNNLNCTQKIIWSTLEPQTKNKRSHNSDVRCLMILNTCCFTLNFIRVFTYYYIHIDGHNFTFKTRSHPFKTSHIKNPTKLVWSPVKLKTVDQSITMLNRYLNYNLTGILQ